MTILAGTAIVQNNKILLLKTTPDSSQPNTWGPPAGHLDPGETPQQTAIRETKEETGLDVSITGISSIISFGHSDKSYLFVLYTANISGSSSTIHLQPEETSDYTWASLDEIESEKLTFRIPPLKDMMIYALTHESYPLDLYQDLGKIK